MSTTQLLHRQTNTIAQECPFFGFGLLSAIVHAEIPSKDERHNGYHQVNAEMMVRELCRMLHARRWGEWLLTTRVSHDVRKSGHIRRTADWSCLLPI